jgi:predicted MPP superfamily phosphohydrolase
MPPNSLRSSRLRTTLFVLLLLALALGVWSVAVEPRQLRVHEVSVAVPDWPPTLAGLRVALLTDLHVGSPYIDLEKLARVVSLTNGAKPDLILILGDLMIDDVLGGKRILPEASAPLLGRLRAPLGVYAVLGNHDAWFDGPRVAAALNRTGVAVLDDESRPLDFRSNRLWIAGIGDFWTGRHDISRALRGIPPGEPVLAFTHNPDLFPQIPQRVGLTVAGHTHGGQVALPFLGRPIVPSRYGQRYAIGLVSERGRRLYVSPGIGTSIIPVRFRVPPEITILRLVAGRPER